MTFQLVVLEENDKLKLYNKACEFKQDILVGLSHPQKMIPSKYFYDDYGSDLFNKITQHPDYYLTRCEIEILRKSKPMYADILRDDDINLIELGPGEGIKTNLILHEFLQRGVDFSYIPIDISFNYVSVLLKRLHQQYPLLNTLAIQADFFHGLDWIKQHSTKRNFLLFLGSSIGNFDLLSAADFLRHLSGSLRQGDYVLIGFDLQKDVEILLRAYDDNSGLTREFNLNLLRRINLQLHANFNVEHFAHRAVYNETLGAMESYLVSKKDQVVNVSALNQQFMFRQDECIHTEYSFKYLDSQIRCLAEQGRFRIIQNWYDKRRFFVDSLWEVY